MKVMRKASSASAGIVCMRPTAAMMPCEARRERAAQMPSSIPTASAGTKDPATSPMCCAVSRPRSAPKSVLHKDRFGAGLAEADAR
jgi:hypothetical protein